MSVAPLPRDGTYVIGRGSEVDIPLEDTSVSRRHATIIIQGDTASIEDLASQNGTRVNGKSILERTPLGSGDVIGFGQTQLVFYRTTREVKPRLMSPDDFGRRVEAETDRSLRYLRPFAILVLGGGDRGADDELLVESILGAMRAMDVVARLDDRAIGVLLIEYAPGAELALHRAAIRADRKLRAGLARWPDDSASGEPLIEAARAAWESAGAGKLAVAPEVERVRDVAGRPIVFVEPAMIQLFALVDRLAPSDAPVLISGESGSGKEIVARAIHQASPRREQPFVSISCAASDPQQIEAELFGSADRGGLLETARGGSIYIEEVDRLPLAAQAKLLRAIEEKKIRRAGETEERSVDVRMIAATNRDLAKAKDEGTFRSDLFYRLNVTTLLVPPLARRPRDIPCLARRFLTDLATAASRATPVLQPATLRLLSTYEWPGNVRELRSVIERALAMSIEGVIEPWMLPLDLGGADEGAEGGEQGSPFRPLDEEIRDLERRRIEQALQHTGGVQTKAAALLSVPLRTFYLKVKQYGIDASRRRPT